MVLNIKILQWGWTVSPYLTLTNWTLNTLGNFCLMCDYALKNISCFIFLSISACFTSISLNPGRWLCLIFQMKEWLLWTAHLSPWHLTSSCRSSLIHLPSCLRGQDPLAFSLRHSSPYLGFDHHLILLFVGILHLFIFPLHSSSRIYWYFQVSLTLRNILSYFCILFKLLSVSFFNIWWVFWGKRWCEG